MDVHRVRRLAWVLVASQIRASGRNADARSWTGQPGVYAWADLALFLGAAVVGGLVTAAFGLDPSVVRALVRAALPFLPLLAVGAVIVGGVMFELIVSAKFAASDAANWLPMGPEEYVLASALAIAYSYSLPIALLLGAFVGLAVGVGLGGAVAASGGLCVLGLVEGALLVEMVRSVGQRTALSSPRRGRLSLALRAVAIVALIVLLQLAFNPIFLFDSLQGLLAFGQFTAYLPPFWGTYALLSLLGGGVWVAAVFAAGAVGFVAFLLYGATVLRRRFWAVATPEFHLGPYRYGGAHPVLRALGLSHAECAIVTKDLHGFGRRREMLPPLVLPVVLLIVIFLESGTGATGLQGPGVVLYAGWATSFSALLIACTSLGQERKAFWHLYAAPIPARSVFRAKLVAAVIPAWLASASVAVFVAIGFGVGPVVALGLAVVAGAAGFAGAMWGLAFAARYSDFEERPRPQPMHPGALLVAIGSGSALAFAILLPGTSAFLYSGGLAFEGGVGAAAITIAVCVGAWALARSGFTRLMQEIPF